MFLLYEAPVYLSSSTWLDTLGVAALLHCQTAVKLYWGRKKTSPKDSLSSVFFVSSLLLSFLNLTAKPICTWTELWNRTLYLLTVIISYFIGYSILIAINLSRSSRISCKLVGIRCLSGVVQIGGKRRDFAHFTSYNSYDTIRSARAHSSVVRAAGS
jgi:hypothetical protein